MGAYRQAWAGYGSRAAGTGLEGKHVVLRVSHGQALSREAVKRVPIRLQRVTLILVCGWRWQS